MAKYNVFFIILFFAVNLHSQHLNSEIHPAISDSLINLEAHIRKCLANDKYAEAKDASLLALRLSRQAKIDSMIGKNLFNTGNAYKNLSNFDSSIYYLDQISPGMSVSPKLLAKAQLDLAVSYENIGKMDSVSSIMKRMKTNPFLLKDSLNEIKIKFLMFRGVLSENKGKYEKALSDYMHALHISEVIKDSASITDNLVNIGAFYFNLEKYPKCIEYYEQALSYLSKRGRSESLQACVTMRTMGIAYARTGKAQVGLQYANKAIGIATKLNINRLLVFCYIGIATIYLEIKDYTHAEDYYLQCENMLKNTDLKFNKLIIYGQLGRVYYEQKKYLAARHYFELAHDIALQVGRKSSIASSYEDLAKTEAALGNFSKAYRYQQTYTVYRDSINEETSSKNIAEMETRYQTEKKQHEIALLDVQNRTQTLKLRNQKWELYSLLAGLSFILIIAGLFWKSYRTKQLVNKELNENNEELTVLNEKLNEANESKTKLFSIISHDLRSPVASLYQFLKMKEEGFAQKDKQSLQKYNDLMLQSAENLAEVMEDLLIWAKSQMDYFELSLETINVREFLTEAIKIHDIQLKQKNIVIDLNCPSQLEFITDINFLKIILRNLVSNAVKFSPENEHIMLSATADNNYLLISVKDNGIGLTREQIDDIFSWGKVRTGLSGIGLKLTKEFAEKLNGSLEILSTSGEGSDFQVRLKILKN